MADSSSVKGAVPLEGAASPKPRYSSSFSIDSLLSSSRPSSRPSSPATTDAAVVTSSSTPQQGHYNHPGGHTYPYGSPMQSTPAGAFHLSLPKVLENQTPRSLPQKRQRQEETPSTSSTTSSSSPSGSLTSESDLEDRAAKRPHLEEGARDTSSPLEEEEDDLHRDSPSPTDSSSGSGSPSSDAPSNGRRKKNRTSFTPDQISQLERNFMHHRYLAAPERTRLARRLELSEQQIKTWFQNRRMKEKRQVKDGDMPSSIHLSPSSTGVLPPTSTYMMSSIGTPIMTSHAAMTSHPMAVTSSPSSLSMHMSGGSPSSLSMHMSGGSPPLMHAGMSGHVFGGPAHHFPGYPAPHHVHTGAHNMPLPPLYQSHHGIPEYTTDFMRPYHAMTMPVML